MKRLLFLQLALIVVGSLASSCSSDNQNNKEKNDLIAAAKLEAARLDSIRQDSIARRNFSSHDLAFHELHGKVRKCEYIRDNNVYKTCTFDKNGSWDNYPRWFISEKEDKDRNFPSKIQRDSEGKIFKIYEDITDVENDIQGMGITQYIWEKGLVRTHLCSSFYYGVNEDGYNYYNMTDYHEGRTSHLFYDENKVLVKFTSTSDNGDLKRTYYNYKLDKYGNWIEREYTEEENFKYSPGTTIRTLIEKRKITYY